MSDNHNFNESCNKNNMAINFKQDGFLSMPNDSIVKTLLVAVSLCLVCSIVVSTAAVVLKPIQLENKKLDKKKNILTVAGIEDNSKSIDELFAQIETKVVDLASGEYTTAVDIETFDQRKASKDPKYRIPLTSKQDIAQISGLSKYANVYLVRAGAQEDGNNGGKISKIILPVKGYGLWSTLYGFLCLQSDAQTACGINFYEHNETPGLGGEVDNPAWQALWKNKQVFNQDGLAEIGLIKGRVEKNTPNAEYKIDGLAGATLTSKGVTNLVRFWVSENGFGPYLQKVRDQQKSQYFRDKQEGKQRETQRENRQGEETAIKQKLKIQDATTNEQQQLVEAQVVETHITEAPVDEALVIESPVVESPIVETEVIEAEVIQTEVVEPLATESQITEIEATEIEATEIEATEIEATEIEATEIEATEIEATEIEATEIEATEIEVIETPTIDTEVNYGE